MTFKSNEFLGYLRAIALLAVVAGALSSVTLLLRAGSRNSSLVLLVVLFSIWVVTPFVVLGWASLVSTRWSRVTRVTLYCVTLAVTLGSLAGYGGLIEKPAGSPNVFMFVAIPPASLLLVAIVLPIAAVVSGRSSSRP